MADMNWGRLLLGTVIAGTIAFLGDGLLHNKLLMSDWQALARGLGLPTDGKKHRPAQMLYFVLFDLGRGFLAMIVYVLAQPRLGTGTQAAVVAGLISWIGCCVTTPAEFIPLGFFNETLWMKSAAFQLVTSIIAAIAGAAVVRW